MPLSFAEYYNRFRTLCETVEADDLASEHPHSGHGFWDHDCAVAMKAARLSPDDDTAQLAFVAGIIHSTDRKVAEGDLDTTIDRYLGLTDLSPDDCNLIKEAVARHMEFKDKDVETRSYVQKSLMDADKLINMELSLVIRSGQFQPTIPVVELEYIDLRAPGARYNNPASTYRKPSSVLEDIAARWSGPNRGGFTLRQPRRRLSTSQRLLAPSSMPLRLPTRVSASWSSCSRGDVLEGGGLASQFSALCFCRPTKYASKTVRNA